MIHIIVIFFVAKYSTPLCPWISDYMYYKSVSNFWVRIYDKKVSMKTNQKLSFPCISILPSSLNVVVLIL